MTDRVYNVLFLCTGNSARSILAESILQKATALGSKLREIGQAEGATSKRGNAA